MVAVAPTSCDDDDDDLRIAALNAVLQMDPDRAVPLLKTVLARRDAGAVCLRRKAVFLVSQKRTSETSAILLNAVRNDPDREVREQAVFWLSQVPGDETVAALDSVLRDPKTDQEIQEKAIFALSQHWTPLTVDPPTALAGAPTVLVDGADPATPVGWQVEVSVKGTATICGRATS